MDLWGGVRVIGTEGFIEVFWDGDIRNAIRYAEPGWKPSVVEAGHSDQMIGLVRNAVDCLQSGQEPEASCQKALRASEILFALYESARIHARIELPLAGVTDNPLHTLLDTK
jgi:predicted dehydrogenase